MADAPQQNTSAQNLQTIGAGATVGATVGASVGSIIPGIGTAIGGAVGGVVGAVGGAVVDLVNYYQANTAEAKEERANKAAAQGLDVAYQAAESQVAPYTAEGNVGMNRLSQLGDFSYNAKNLQNDPGYQFQKQQGERAIQAGQNASGLGMSSATQASLANFNQQIAGTAYDDAFIRALKGYQTNVAGAQFQTEIGQNASNRLSQLTENYGINKANLEIGKGNIQAAGIAGQSAAIGQFGNQLSQIGSSLNANSQTASSNPPAPASQAAPQSSYDPYWGNNSSDVGTSAATATNSLNFVP